MIPADKSARQVSDALAQDFGGSGQTPVTVAITARPDQGAAVAGYARRVAAIDGAQVSGAPLRLDRSTWQLDAQVQGDPAGSAAQRVVAKIRDLKPPFQTRVTGDAAEFVDQQAAIGSRLAPAIVLLCGLTFVVLWLMTGSVVLPAKAIVMTR